MTDTSCLHATVEQLSIIERQQIKGLEDGGKWDP